MTPEQLRLKHPRLVYKSYTVSRDDHSLSVRHEFLLEPDIVFRPSVTIPFSGHADESALNSYAFNLGLVEAISYWKSACPKEFVVEAGDLTPEQVRFWYDLLIHGLGEFFYRNTIDFTAPDFLKIIPAGQTVSVHDDRAEMENMPSEGAKDDLVLVGGGKDSAVTLKILKQSNRTLQTMILNPTQAALSNVMTEGVTHPILVERTIDPTLLQLNAAGYLNGHTPFSAYLAFLGVMVGYLYGNENVIVSNERSASEGNVMYHGMEVNHQYSKSFRFEEMFRTYSRDFLTGSPSYFSFLRPFNAIQISKLFATAPEFFRTFRSCNVGSKTNTWCGTCPKCAFTYLVLFPFVPYQDLQGIFGRDYFTDPVILSYVRELTGLTPVKPFECVGTRDESVLSVYLSIKTYVRDNREIPEGLLKIKSDLNRTDNEITLLKARVMNDWGDMYNLPPEHLAILKHVWQEINAGK